MGEKTNFPRFTGTFNPQTFSEMLNQGIIESVEAYHIVDFLATSVEQDSTPELFHMESVYGMDGDASEPLFTKEVFVLNDEGRIVDSTYPKQKMSAESFYTRMTQEQPDSIDTRMQIRFNAKLGGLLIPCTIDLYGEENTQFVLEIQSTCQNAIDVISKMEAFSNAHRTDGLVLEQVYSPVLEGAANGESITDEDMLPVSQIDSDTLVEEVHAALSSGEVDFEGAPVEESVPVLPTVPAPVTDSAISTLGVLEEPAS
jgi:hypothetical protein